MEENLFKDVQVVAVAANEEAPDLVYIDDEEEEPRTTSGMTAIRIELRDEDPKRSSTPFETCTDNPMSIKLPINNGQNSTEGSEITESFKSCIVGSDYVKTQINIDEDCLIEDQEQFEIVGNAEEKDTSSDSTNDSTRANKSNESNDHSYSQPPPPKESNSFCDDIVKNILQEANLSSSKNAIVLLKEYTKFFENLTNEHQHSQLSLYLKQMMFSLDNNENQILSKPDEIVPDETVQNKEVENGETSKNDNSDNVVNQGGSEQVSETMKSVEIGGSNEMEASSADISMRSDVIQVKQEIMETNTGNVVMENKEECKVNGTIVEEAEKLKVYVKKAQEKTADFCENNQKLLDSVFVSEEDVENGNTKFRTSLNNFISFNVALLMAVDNKSDEDKSLIDNEINKIKKRILQPRDNNIEVSIDDIAESSRKSSIDEKASKSRKSSVSSLDKDLSDGDSDSSINRLTNLKSLDQRRYDTQKSQNVQEKSAKVTQKAKKKTKEHSDDSSINSESSESESESPKKMNKSDDEDKSSEDEELKLKHKLEMKARDNLLASSDDDGEDEESYVTSQTSDFSSDDERNVNKVSKKHKKPVKKLKSSDEEMSDKEDKSNEPASSPKVNGEAPQIDISPVKSDESMSDVKENGEDKKSRKRQRKSSFEREIFNKSLLDSDDESSADEADKSDGQQATKKMRKGSQGSSKRNSVEASKESVVDLTQQSINISADRMAPTLEKYLEKISSNAEDLSNADQSSSSMKVDSSPKKNDQQKSSKAPSPSLDDIDCISISSESDSEISSTISEGPSRRRKQLTEEELKEETKKAKRDENERVKKLEDKEKKMTQYLTQRLSQSDVLAADELVLDYSEEKKLAVVVHETLVGKLKDHQVDGIKFMYNK